MKYVNHTQQIIAKSQLKNYELFFHFKKRNNELMRKNTFRKRLKIKSTNEILKFIKENVLQIIVEKQIKKKRNH